MTAAVTRAAAGRRRNAPCRVCWPRCSSPLAAVVGGLRVAAGARRRPTIALGYRGRPGRAWPPRFVACRRIGAMIVVPRPVRALLAAGLARPRSVLGIGAASRFALRQQRRRACRRSWPCRCCSAWSARCLAFLRLPLGAADRAGAGPSSLLDGATVAVAGALIFWYVVLDLAAARHSTSSPRSAAARRRRRRPARPRGDRQGRVTPGRRRSTRWRCACWPSRRWSRVGGRGAADRRRRARAGW